MKAELQYGKPGGPYLTKIVPAKIELLWWQEKGLSFTPSGYGRRIPTRYKVQVGGRWRRVYCCIFSNSGTCYIGPSKEWEAVVGDIIERDAP
jgi:hypothetical protein